MIIYSIIQRLQSCPLLYFSTGPLDRGSWIHWSNFTLKKLAWNKSNCSQKLIHFSLHSFPFSELTFPSANFVSVWSDCCFSWEIFRCLPYHQTNGSKIINAEMLAPLWDDCLWMLEETFLYVLKPFFLISLNISPIFPIFKTAHIWHKLVEEL